jgi:hypothetical protein
MQSALQATDPYKALLAIGAIPFPDRVKTLRDALQPRRAAFAQKHWNRASNDLV